MKKPGIDFFRIEKHYLDCIDDKGNCFIIYHAKLSFLFTGISYSGLVFSDENGITTEKSSLWPAHEPLIQDPIRFSHAGFSFQGTWKSIDSSFEPFKYNDATNHELNWNCYHPKSVAEIIFNKNLFKGLGYAEKITITIKLRDLPIDELRWGRFLCENHTIIWINWKGHSPLNKLFCNGSEFRDAVFENDKITFGDGHFTLCFREIEIIRSGKLDSILSGFRWLKVFFSNRVLNTVENKFKARSLLFKDSVERASGWSLYEIVVWKK